MDKPQFEIKEMKVDPMSPLFDKTGMLFKEFPSDYRQIRYFTLLIVQSAPLEIKEINLLEQQISEIIKNAVKHGNKSDIKKKVKAWYSFSASHARLIVEDEGEGFKEMEIWNEFNRKRLQCLYEQNFEELGDFVSFRTDHSDDIDGGNALFAALEYWNGGFVYNDKRNCVAMLKVFPQRRHGISIDEARGE
jgi:serine/threonine-protein kinase RsbW